MNHYARLQERMKITPVINTHCHHRQGEFLEDMGLAKVFQNAYIDWIRPLSNDTDIERRSFLNSIQHNSYYVWLARAIQEIYPLGDPISSSNWDEYSRAMALRHASPSTHFEMLRDLCGYEKTILDAYWNPGSDNRHPELFAPTFRINSFLFGYAPDATDHNGNNCYSLYPETLQFDGSLTEFIAGMRKIISQKLENGTVALKCAAAYERGLDFEPVSAAEASLVFSQKHPSPNAIKAFQDYVFHEICEIAAEMDVPFQCHTGLGLLTKSSAIWMRDAIVGHPKTKFVLFHGNYPWLDDLLGLVHYTSQNIWADLCWLPIISPSACESLLHGLIEVGRTDQICWGCDTWTAEESYGALLAARHVIAKVLSTRIAEGYMNISQAEQLADQIFYSNAKKLYTRI